MKKFIGILLSVAMLVSAMPVWAATGTVENLLDKGDVVFTSCCLPKYSSMSGIYDNNPNTLTYVGECSNNHSPLYIQAKLYTPMQITKVTLTTRHDTVQGSSNVDILLSNDPNFATYVTVGNTGTGHSTSQVLEYTYSDTTKYKYIRLVTTNAVLSFAEIDVFGYYEDTKAPEELVEENLLSKYGVVTTGGGDEIYGATYQWENAFDGSNSKEVYLANGGWVQAELSAPMDITRVDILGRPNHTSSSAVKVFLSNDATNWVCVGETPSAGISAGETHSVSVDGSQKYRYIKLCKTDANAPTGDITFGEVEIYGYYETIEFDEARFVNLIKQEGTTTTGGGTPYNNSSTYDWQNAFNGNNSGIVYLSNGGWVQAELTIPMQITRVDVVGRRSGDASSSGMNIWLSKDGTNWVLFGTTPSIPVKTTYRLHINSDDKYKYIRMSNGTPDAPTGLIQFGELEVYGYFPQYEMGSTDKLAEQVYSIYKCDISKDTSGNVVATTGVINKDSAPVTSPLFILALYNMVGEAETLIATATVPAERIEPDGVKVVNATIPASALTGKTYTKARLFAFDAQDGITPICKSLTVNINN